MNGRFCYLNDGFIPESEAKISISDWFLWEGGVYDVARTYNYIPFKLDQHIDRLFNSLNSVPFIKFDRRRKEVLQITEELLQRNRQFIQLRDDCRIVYRISRGICFEASAKPTFLVHIVPYSESVTESYAHFLKWYERGVHLVIVNTRQIPVQCLDPKIKHSNRLCNRLAQYEAAMVDPEAVALMLNVHGYITECPRDNFVMVKNNSLYTSRLTDCLSGVTRQVVLALAQDMGIPCIETDLTVYDLYQANEIMITGTSIAIAPVSKLNLRTLPGSLPGPITRGLQVAFSELVNYDIVERAREYAK
ncbi:aminotransferase class IV [Chloroflexota bacterium]